MGRSFGKSAVAVCLVFALGSPVQAQLGVASLSGVVQDALSTQPVGDVVVTVTSPNLQGERIIVTDDTGTFRVGQLPPGTYEVRLEKEGYAPFTRRNLELRLDTTIRLILMLQPLSVQSEEVLVVGTAPTVDIGSSATGLEVGAAHLSKLPLLGPQLRGGATRSFEGLAELAPQTGGDRYGVGMNGAQGPENQFFVDGVSVNDAAYGPLATPLSVEFMEAVNVLTGGYMPEFGRSLGGIFNVVTKSGSNEFKGSVFGTWTPGALAEPGRFNHSQASSIAVAGQPHNLGDFGFEVGGPIIKDKLWFFAGLNPSVTRMKINRKLVWYQETTDEAEMFSGYETDAQGQKIARDLPGSESSTFADSRTLNYIGKLTFSPKTGHQLSLSVYGAPTSSGGDGSFGLSPLDGSIDRFRGTSDPYAGARTGGVNANGFAYRAAVHDVGLKYAGGFLDQHLLLDVSGGFHFQQTSQLPIDSSALGSDSGLASVPQVQLGFPNSLESVERLSAENSAQCQSSVAGAVRCPVDEYRVGGAGFLQQATITRVQAKGIVTGLFQALGHHVAKAGVDVEQANYLNEKGYSGGTILKNSAPDFGSNDVTADFRRFGYFRGPTDFVELKTRINEVQSTSVGAFLQDSWNVLDVATLNAGLRFDQQYIGAGGRPALVLPGQVSPRVGVIVDVTRRGLSRLYANFARFYELMPLNFADRNFPQEPGYFGFRDNAAGQCDFVQPNITADQVKDKFNSTCANAPNVFGVGFSTVRSPVDPQLQPQSSDEIVVGGEYQIWGDLRLGVNWTHRYLNAVIEDMSRDEGTTYFIGNPGYGIARDFEKATRTYDAVTATATQTRGSWLLQASYTWSYLRGNYPGFFQVENGQLDPNMNTNFDLLSMLPNRTGRLSGNSTHVIKLYLGKEFELSSRVKLITGGSYRSRSGAPISALGSHPLYGPNEVFVTARGSMGELPWVHQIDGRVAVAVRLPGDLEVQLTADVFNLFNFQAVTEVDQALTKIPVTPNTDGKGLCVLGGPAGDCAEVAKADGSGALTAAELSTNYRQPLAYQAPRSFRFGLRVSF